MRLVALAVALVCTVVISACGALCPAVACDCAAPILVTVSVPDAGTLSNLRVEGAGVSGSCSTEDGLATCHVGAPIGPYSFEVKADGYEPQTVTGALEPSTRDPNACGCDCGVKERKIHTVNLIPAQ